ncbi:MAG: trypsin-like serine protease, partial [Proteobacteria bacterium]
PQQRGTDIAIFSIQFKAESEKKAWDRFVTAASLDYSLPMKGRDVILAGFGCAGKEAMLFLEAPVSCTNSPEFAYMKMAHSKIMEMNSHYFTLKGVTNIEGTNGFISNGDSGGPVYSTSGAVIGINSAGNLSAILVSNKIYNAETYHSWVGFDAVRGWIDSALTVDKSKSPFLEFFEGVVAFPDGSYVGELRNGIRSGAGQMTYTDFRTYNGAWLRDKRNGYGEQVWAPSSKYEKYVGQWIDDRPEGLGTLLWKDGTRYVGGFKGALYDGQGHIERPNGDIRDGTWVLDKLEGEAILTTRDGTRWKENYSNGARISAVKI